MEYQYGWPDAKRRPYIDELVKHSDQYKSMKYSGRQRQLKVIEVPIELLEYRVENIRTINAQKEWLAKHPDEKSDFFTSNSTSGSVQMVQHELLQKIVKKDKLVDYFKIKKDGVQHEQQYELVISDDGIVVNGNCRLCTWRDLYYSDKQKYKHFQMISVVVLPDHDPEHMYELEVDLSIDEPEKDEYIWHAIAADSKQRLAISGDINKIAKRRNYSPKEMNLLLDAYDAAEVYLQRIGHPNEWSLVDQQLFAFKQYVLSRANLNSAQKEFFRIITDRILTVPAKGERLYKVIPKVASNLDQIADKLVDEFDIKVENEDDSIIDDIDILLGGDSSDTDNRLAGIAQQVAKISDDNSTTIVDVIQRVIDTQDELDKEKDHGEYVFKMVKRAATDLNNAVSNMTPEMNKEGVGKQIDNILLACEALKQWLR